MWQIGNPCVVNATITITWAIGIPYAVHTVIFFKYGGCMYQDSESTEEQGDDDQKGEQLLSKKKEVAIEEDLEVGKLRLQVAQLQQRVQHLEAPVPQALPLNPVASV